MQTSTQPQPQIATIPPPPQPVKPPSLTIVGPDGQTRVITVPITEDDMSALLARRASLSDQLTSVSARRNELSREIRRGGNPVSEEGLQSRIKLLDQRILQLETDLAVTGQQIAAAPSELAAGTEVGRVPPGGGDDFDEGVMAGGFGVLVAMSALLLFLRRRWKRGPRAAIKGAAVESPQRLERLEQGMDAIAIEIERISEGQRFVTRLLSESQPPLNTARLPESAIAEKTPAKKATG